MSTSFGLFRLLPAAAIALTGTGPVAFAQSAPIRGFPQDGLEERARVEAVLTQVPDSALLRQYMRVMSGSPHHAGSAGSKAVADFALSKFREFGLDAELAEFEALLPYPVSRHVEMLGPERYVAALAEPPLDEDEDSRDEGQLPPFNAYAADGDVTGELVFVNYGLPEDYERLEHMGIDVEGKVVIAKYGRSWRGIKPKLAAEHGAIACLMYSDPEEDGYYVGDVYPDGPMRPAFGVQRGSVMDMPVYPGDPLTPGWGSVKGARKLDRSEAVTLMSIPVLPLSHSDALPLLRALGGEVVPNDDWKGALPITYHVGPGPARVRVALEFEWRVRPVYNVIARIPGAVYPNQWIIHGNHHDAWVNGAADPISGAVTLLESARAFGELLRTGWRPKRTLIFALWDAEEWGLIGSTEWAEHHADELRETTVTYFNTDGTNRGTLSVAGSHSLETFVRELTRDVSDPETGVNGLEAIVQADLEDAESAEDSARAREKEFSIGALGSGSDYSAFLDHLNLASLNLSFRGGAQGGVYHSTYDSHTFYARFYDTTYVYGRELARALSVAKVRMADAPILPFSFSDAARTYRTYVAEIEERARETGGENWLNLFDVKVALDSLAAAGAAFDEAVDRATGMGVAWLEGQRGELGVINREIYLSERDLGADEGLPRRPWYRHTIYAPGFFTGYGVKTMPGIREAVEQENQAEAQAQAAVVAAAIGRMAARVRGVADRLAALA